MIEHPKTWQMRILEEVAHVQTGLAKGKTELKDAVTMPYLRVANVQDGFLDLSEIKSIQVARGDLARYRLRRNDVLLTEGGDLDKLGRGSIWNAQIDPCLHQNHVFVVRTNADILRPEFLALLTASPYGRRYFLGCAKQKTNLASINSTQLKQFPVFLPPIREQNTISSLFAVWDTGAEILAARLKEAQSRKGGLMQQLLTGRKRFKEFVGESWRFVRIDSLLEPSDRYVSWSDDVTYRFASIRRRSCGLFDRGTFFGHEVKTKVLKLLKAGDFLIFKRQVVHGAWGMVPEPFAGFGVSDEYDVLVNRSARVLDLRFFNYLSQTRRLWNMAYLASNGVHIEKLIFNFDDFAKERIKIPSSVEEQGRIVGVLETCDREIELLQKQLAAMKEQKRGLMQKLLTGEIRVKAKPRTTPEK